MSRLVSIAACQYYYRDIADFDEFATHVRGLLNDAEGADLAVFPELFTFELFTTFDDWQNLPQSELSRIHEYTDAYRELFAGEAKTRGQHIAAGSHLVKDGDAYLNTAHLFGPDGSLFTHAKTHIFPAEANWATNEGDAADVVELPFARVGFNICYEAEIPECAATLTERGAEIILCPSFTVTEWGFWRVRHCAQALCVQNQVYAVHASLAGDLPIPLMPGFARSSVLSPCDAPWPFDGVVAQAETNKEMVVTGEVDIDLLYSNREMGAAPTYRDRRRRRELYTVWPSHISGTYSERGNSHGR